MVDVLSQRLVAGELWELVEPLLPEFTPRPQGGGVVPTDQRAVFTAVVYVLTNGCAWRMLPESFGVSVPTAHRRFSVWTRAGVWRRLHRALLEEFGWPGLDRLVASGGRRSECPGKKRGDLTGPNPTDRGKPGSKQHTLSDRAGIALSVAVSAANVHDSQALKALVMAIPAVRSRRGPRGRRPGKLHADTAYDQPELRLWVRRRGMAVGIARKGIESSERLARHRWVIERTLSWLTGYHRLNIRHDRKGIHYLGFLTLAAALTCFKKLAKAKASI